MGAKNAKPALEKIESLQKGSQALGENVESLKTSLNNLSQELFTKSEIDTRLEKVQQDHSSNNEKLSQLLDLNREQQQVIVDLGNKYSQLYEDYYNQQKMLSEMTEKYEDKFNSYEVGINEAKNKLQDIEKEVAANSEFNKVLGIRKTDNMIKKEKVTVKEQPKKAAAAHTKAAPAPANTRGNARDKLQNARNQRKMEKEAVVIVNEQETAPKTDSPPGTDQNFHPNFLDIIINEKSAFGFGSPKKTLFEVDMNTL